MALVFCDGFDYYDTAAYNLLIWSTPSNGNAPGATSGGRFGTSRAVTTTFSMYRDVPAQTTYIVAFAFKTSAINSNTIVQFLDGSTLHVDVRTDSTGHLIVTRNGTTLATATDPLSSGVWYHIQFKAKIDDTTGTYEVRVDGSSSSTKGIPAATGQDTRNGAAAQVTRIQFANSAILLDDVIVLDTTGSLNNDFPGDAKITLSMPTGAGNKSQFTPSAGSNWQNVDENPPNDDTDYNSSSTAGNIDTYTRAAVSLSGSIIGVKNTLIHRKDDAGTRQIASVCRSGVTDFVGATKTAASTYTPDAEYYETDPNTAAAWTESNFNSAEFGVKLIA